MLDPMLQTKVRKGVYCSTTVELSSTTSNNLGLLQWMEIEQECTANCKNSGGDRTALLATAARLAASAASPATGKIPAFERVMSDEASLINVMCSGVRLR